MNNEELIAMRVREAAAHAAARPSVPGDGKYPEAQCCKCKKWVWTGPTEKEPVTCLQCWLEMDEPKPADLPNGNHSVERSARLRPCPFCGTERTRIHEWLFGAVIICECGGRGPEGYGDTKIPMACDLWNRRDDRLPPVPGRCHSPNDPDQRPGESPKTL
jgi:hypothetical protein